MELVKKPYKPKEDKVQKLEKVYTQLKAVKPVKCDLFTKSVKVLAFLVLLSSCSAQYHLKQAIKKDPNIITERVIRQVDTLIIRDSLKSEYTYVTKSVDTIIIDNERFKTTIYRYHDTLKLIQILKGDTIRITKKVVVPVVEYKKWWEAPDLWAIVVCLIGGIWIIKRL